MRPWKKLRGSLEMQAAVLALTDGLERMKADEDIIASILRAIDTVNPDARATAANPTQPRETMNKSESPTVEESNPIHASRLRRFRLRLRRNQDETGISGTGIVAEGVQFSNGYCALTWLTPMHSVAVYPNTTQLEAIHGHNGRTLIEFIDPPDHGPQLRLEFARIETSGPETFDFDLDLIPPGSIDKDEPGPSTALRSDANELHRAVLELRTQLRGISHRSEGDRNREQLAQKAVEISSRLVGRLK